VPDELALSFRQALRQTGQEPSIPLQSALHEFIEQGFFSRHVRRMRAIYAERHDKLTRALRGYLGAMGEPLDAAGGLQVMFRLNADWSPEELAAKARCAGFGIASIRSPGATSAQAGGLLFGLGAIGDEAIEVNVRRLAKVLLAR